MSLDYASFFMFTETDNYVTGLVREELRRWDHVVDFYLVGTEVYRDIQIFQNLNENYFYKLI